MLNVSHVRVNMDCWHCGNKVIWGGDVDISHESEDFQMETNLKCTKCHSEILVYLPKETE